MFVRKLLYGFLYISTFSTPVFAQNVETIILYGPDAFQGQPKSASYVRTFSAPAGLQNTRLELVNGAGMEGLLEPCGESRNFGQLLKCLSGNLRALLVPRRRALSVEVKLNGQIVLAEKLGALNFSKIKPVATATQNNLEVKVTGSKNSFVTIRIRGDKLNRAPIPEIQITQANRVAPSMANFDGSRSSDPDGHSLTYLWDFDDGTPTKTDAVVNHEFLSAGTYSVRLTVTDQLGLATSIESMVQVDPVPFVPDPSPAATEIDPAQISSRLDKIGFLIEGPSAVQSNIVQGALEEHRMAQLRGKVLSESGLPLAGVKVSILEHPEYGETYTRIDGIFDLVVNGGRTLTISYERSGHFTVQRSIRLPIDSAIPLEDVTMVRPDEKVTQIQMNSPLPQVHQASTVTDSDGPRTAVVMIPANTSAELVLPGGGTKTVSSLNIRATEFTVGADGPSRMPADLPPQSAYTYCVDLNADEALANGAESVRFSKPVSFYVTNFLNSPVGTIIPTGTYDPKLGVWKGELDTHVMGILSETNGRAVVDVSGLGSPATAQDLQDLGITDQELEQLAATYDPGATLWRARLTHFSYVDINYGWPSYFSGLYTSTGPTPPDHDRPPRNRRRCDGFSEYDACEIDFTRLTLTEKINLPGIPFNLNYASDRQLGFTAGNTYEVPLSGPDVDPEVLAYHVKTQVAGREFNERIPNGPNLKYLFTLWDGKDAFGRLLTTPEKAKINIRLEVTSAYLACKFSAVSAMAKSSSWGQAPGSGSSEPCELMNGRSFAALSQSFEITLGPKTAPRFQGIGGWSAGIHHFFDPMAKILYTGDGQLQSSATISSGKKIVTLAGTGVQGGAGDGGMATDAQLRGPRGLALTQNGSIIFVDGCCVIRRIEPDGTIRRIAGAGQGFAGDGGLARDALFNSISRPSLTSTGEIVFADTENHVIRAINRQGFVRTIAGTGGVAGNSGDDGPAASALLRRPGAVLVAKDGNIYFTDIGNHVLRMIDTNGIMRRVAGTGVAGFSGDKGPASQARLRNPAFCTEDENGAIYLADRGNHVIRVIFPDGTIDTIAGTPEQSGFSGDNGPALSARFNLPQDLAIDASGNLFIVDQENGAIRKIDPRGNITTAVGRGLSNSLLPQQPNRVSLLDPINIAINPIDQTIVFTELGRFVIRGYKDIWAGEFNLTSDDGREVYQFDAQGRHLRTSSRMTGQTLYQFEYDLESRLVEVRDGYGARTRILRGPDGSANTILGPDGHEIRLESQSDNLAAVILPEGERYEMSYYPGGLIETFRRPAGQTNRFTFDLLGRLVRDEKPGGGFFALLKNGLSVEITDSLNRKRNFREFTNASDKESYELTRKDGIRIVQSRNEFTQSVVLNTATNFAEVTTGDIDPLSGISEYPWKMEYPLVYPAIDERRTLTKTGLQDFIYTITTNSPTLNRTSTYDSATRTQTIQDTSGEFNQIVTDLFENPTRIQVGGLAPVNMSYDIRGRLSQIQQGDRETRLTYDARGNLSEVLDPLGQRIQISYDQSSRPTVLVQNDLSEIRSTYDPNGNVTSLSLPTNVIHEMLFGVFDLLTQYRGPSVAGITGAISYAFNTEKDLVSETHADGRVISIDYDSAGRGRIFGNGSNFITHEYDSFGDLTEILSSDSVKVAKDFIGPKLQSRTYSGRVIGGVNYSYLDANHLDFFVVNGSNQVNFTYNSNGRLTRASYLGSSFSLNLARDLGTGLITQSSLGTAATTMGYNEFGEISLIETSISGTPIFRQIYTRDRLGRVTNKVEMAQGATDSFDYIYDSRGRLSSVRKNGAVVSIYSFDANGNRVSAILNGQSYLGSYDAQDRVISYGTNTYAFSAHGDLLSKTNSTTNQVSRFNYDVFGQLKRAEVSPTLVVDYLTDGENRRVQRMVNGVVLNKYTYHENGQMAAEYDSDDNLRSIFVYASQGHSPDYMIKEGVDYYLVKDQLGSIRMVVQASNGVVSQRIDYDEYGRILSDSNPGFQPFGFAGGLYDHNTGLVRFGARDYDPELGRWTAKDPIRFEGGDTNLFSYVANDPINAVDPDGLQSQLPVWYRRTKGIIKYGGAVLKCLNKGMSQSAPKSKVCKVEGPEKKSQLNDFLDCFKSELSPPKIVTESQ